MRTTKKDKAYSALAGFYEDLSDKEIYEKWGERISERVKKYAPGKSGCDAACGSGYFTRRLKRDGFEVYGADVSAEMLAEAEKRAREEGLFIDFLLLDMKNFTSFHKLDFITVINDGMNYLSPDDFVKAIKRFRAALVKGGALIFDVSSAYKLRKVIGDNFFAEDGDDMTYIWFNRLLSDRVEMELTFFVRDGETYVRKDEKHVQYVHEREFIERVLVENGFEIAEETGKDTSETAERLEFVAIKK